MALARTRITEHDVVALKRDIGKWPAGTRGTALIDHGQSKLVEISDSRGQELDLFEIADEDLELLIHYTA
ncbi:MAG TPA: hypothetical protein VLK37_12395 [Solirubrobacterales bacterium]|nr:hypothetical protein [Solirubrobacterales bacterium]